MKHTLLYIGLVLASFAMLPATVQAKAEVEEVLEYVKSVSYPNAKAKHLVEMAQMLTDAYGGEMPDSIDELTKLPGVGRKTANVMLAVWFEKPAMAVDTHVFRVSNRIGLTINSKTPLETEKELVKHIPKRLIPIAHHWLILHGRYTCLVHTSLVERVGQSVCCIVRVKSVSLFPFVRHTILVCVISFWALGCREVLVGVTVDIRYKVDEARNACH